ncbi:DegV family protein [Clostridium sardiniense]|uniref:DegV family protein n=1 Tax=Clostridium sardiniense TaxID=29369 RepID=A0ABS7KYM8_CLOSR|nr:DegV family protein [Clostridium sardiniense]MBY0755703.1 DegV family protein [Clostridium sardiniense]MDQ0460070.1 DegV family protein with EDD domain [Clostridium sardiniense]
MGVKIITDSTSYIPKDIRNELDIEVISLNVIFGGRSYREIDLTNEEFFDELEKLDDLPTSSQPSINEVKEKFENIIKNGDKVVCVLISSDMSGTYQSANMIKNIILEEYPEAEIEILDSRTNCMQMGYAAIVAAKAAKEGDDIKGVVSKAEEVINKSKFLFMPKTLKYLKKGGRIGSAAALVGSILKIVPILTVTDGKTTIFNKVRTRGKAINVIINKVIEDIDKKGLGEIAIHHINCEDEGIELKKKLEDRLKQKGIECNIILDSIGPIIGLHVGPGSIGVAYYTKS